MFQVFKSLNLERKNELNYKIYSVARMFNITRENLSTALIQMVLGKAISHAVWKQFKSIS